VALNLDLGGSIGATPLGAIEAPAVDHLLELLDRPAWQRLCQLLPGPRRALEPAKALCAACLAHPECLLEALEGSWPSGSTRSTGRGSAASTG
jgi:hypothetical protein